MKHLLICGMLLGLLSGVCVAQRGRTTNVSPTARTMPNSTPNSTLPSPDLNHQRVFLHGSGPGSMTPRGASPTPVSPTAANDRVTQTPGATTTGNANGTSVSPTAGNDRKFLTPGATTTSTPNGTTSATPNAKTATPEQQ
jgi:hypothetical protein